jgi:DNA-directed RNA polymerase specialized sigma24 family protein
VPEQRRICPLEEQEVLAAKLAGVPAREIARTLAITEAAVDHRFRGAIARLKRRLEPKPAPRRGAHA